MTEYVGPGKLYKRGDCKVPRVCPAWGSKHGRVGLAFDSDGHITNLRGWLCFDCDYSPGKDPQRCRINAALNERELSQHFTPGED